MNWVIGIRCALLRRALLCIVWPLDLLLVIGRNLLPVSLGGAMFKSVIFSPMFFRLPLVVLRSAWRGDYTQPEKRSPR